MYKRKLDVLSKMEFWQNTSKERMSPIFDFELIFYYTVHNELKNRLALKHQLIFIPNLN